MEESLFLNRNVGQLLDVNTEWWDRPILFQIYPNAAPEQALPLHPHIVLLPERIAGSRITKIEQQSIAEIFFLVHANQASHLP